jgi:hypothetical protein
MHKDLSNGGHQARNEQLEVVFQGSGRFPGKGVHVSSSGATWPEPRAGWLATGWATTWMTGHTFEGYPNYSPGKLAQKLRKTRVVTVSRSFSKLFHASAPQYAIELPEKTAPPPSIEK